MSMSFTGLMSLAQAASGQIVGFTKGVNEVVGSTPVDGLMDSAQGMGHRVEFGHSPDHLMQIFDKHGVGGVGDYITHMGRDLMSPHGVPLMPYTKEVGEFLGLTRGEMISWMCINIGDVVSGGVAISHSVFISKKLLLASNAGVMPQALLVETLLGAGTKIGFSLMNPNPISLAAGVSDLGFLGYAAYGIYCAPKGFSFYAKIVALNTLACGVAASSVSLVIAFLAGDEGNEKYERAYKYFFCGVAAGLSGGIVAVFLPEPISISASTVAGYVVGEQVYERLVETGVAEKVWMDLKGRAKAVWGVPKHFSRFSDAPLWVYEFVQ